MHAGQQESGRIPFADLPDQVQELVQQATEGEPTELDIIRMMHQFSAERLRACYTYAPKKDKQRIYPLLRDSANKLTELWNALNAHASKQGYIHTRQTLPRVIATVLACICQRRSVSEYTRAIMPSVYEPGSDGPIQIVDEEDPIRADQGRFAVQHGDQLRLVTPAKTRTRERV